MILDYNEINRIERENNAILLSRLQKEQQYLYAKIFRHYPEKIFGVYVPQKNGGKYYAKFVKISDVEEIKKIARYKVAKPKQKRGVMGRPYKFCNGCEHYKVCSENIYCEKREKLKKYGRHSSDERFWNNGKPKTHYILCKYAKYKYAHKKTAGQCQKGKCLFYENGDCFLNLLSETVMVDEKKSLQQIQTSTFEILKENEISIVDKEITFELPKEQDKEKIKSTTKMTNEEQVKYLTEKLNALDKSLTEIERSKSEDTNIFYATGMTTQEIKHSAFLAWLLDPRQSHKMYNTFLTCLIKLLYEYRSSEKDIKSNKEILANSGIVSFDDFADFLNADDIVVETEKVITNPDSRIDIFIQSKKTETTIVIENKVFTGTHDEQLYRYEREADVFNGRKIFIYLTPKGDIPTNTEGKYQKKWAILSYGSIVKLLREKINDIPKSKQFLRLVFLLEDYIKMVDTNILKSNESLRSLCKQIRRKHAEAIELLMNYTDNIDEAYDFIYKWLTENITDIHYIYFKGKQLGFYSDKIYNFFAKYGRQVEITKSWFSYGVFINSKDGPVKLGIGLGKDTEEWGEPETIIKQKIIPDKSIGNKYCTLYQITLLSEEDRQKNFEDIKPQLERNLQTAKDKLEEIENQL